MLNPFSNRTLAEQVHWKKKEQKKRHIDQKDGILYMDNSLKKEKKKPWKIQPKKEATFRVRMKILHSIKAEQLQQKSKILNIIIL